MRQFFHALVLGLLVVLPTTAVRSASAQAAAAADAPEKYDAVLAEWNRVNGQLDELAKEFRSASPARQEEIRVEYVNLVGEANGLMPRLRTAAIAQYKTAPNADVELTRLLIGVAANDLRGDHYDDAMELAQLLIQNECPEQAVYGVAGTAAYCLDDFDAAETYLGKARDAGGLGQEGMMYATDANLAKKLLAKELQLRAAEEQADDLPRVLLKTSKGDLVIELYENEAPQAVANFVSLVDKGYYDGLIFHRVLPGFMAQGGCPDGTGGGGPGYNIYCECGQDNHRKHFRGTLSMAHAGPNTGGSQFFLTFRRTSHLDGRHTVFGRVIKGLDLLEELQRIDPDRPSGETPDKIIQAKVLRKRDHKYEPTKVK